MFPRPLRHLLTCLFAALAALGASALPARAQPVISEFMAANARTLRDDDGAFSDWIELHNPTAADVNLAGWSLTDTASNKTKWKLPAVTLPAGGYLVVFASNKDRRDPAKPLHTNFALSASGEYLGLIAPDGTVVSDYAPTFPPQTDDVSYGLVDEDANGGAGASSAPKTFFAQPTPGAPNRAGGGGGGGALTETVAFSRSSGVFATTTAVSLSGAVGDQQIRFVLFNPASVAGRVLDPTAESPVYTEPLEIDTTVVIRAAVFSADGSVRGPITQAHFEKIDASLAGFTSPLSVLVLDNFAGGPLFKDGIDHPAWLYAFDANGGAAPVFEGAPALATPLTAGVRGSSSADFPKKGYNLKLTDERGAKRAQPLIDGGAFEKWALVAPWNYDRTFIHNSVAYALSNRLGRWAPRTQLAEVFFNNGGADLTAASYAGIYTLTDRIEAAAGRVGITPIAPGDTAGSALTGGYILKIDLKDDDEYGFITNRGHPDNGYSSVVVAFPKAADLAPAQRDYIRDYVQKMEDAIYASAASGWSQRTYLDYLDRASWVDHHLLNVLAENVDAFQRSAYFTKDRGGKMVAGPLWDFDRAFGSTDPRNESPEGWMGDNVHVRDLWSIGWWEVLTRDPEFMQDWIDRWQSLRRDELSNGKLAALIEAQGAAVGPLAAARDAAKWPDNTSRYGDYAGEIAHLKSWLLARAAWIDRQFVAAPRASSNGATVRLTPAEGAQLVYTLDGSDPRSLGGALAPGALVSGTAVDLPAGANIHARSYRADQKDVFPGSPWSAAIGVGGASPLAPQSRLINISARGIVGDGEHPLIAGVVVADTAAKRFLARGIGPGLLAFGATGTVMDPQLGIFDAEGVERFRNLGWENAANAAELPAVSRQVGAFPLVAGIPDSALTPALASGAHTLQVTSPSGREGIGLVELYELDGDGRALNLSTRAQVRAGAGVLAGGFVVQGAAYKRMLIRAVGPTLATFGLADALRDPVLTLYSGQNVVAQNDRWSAAENAAALETAQQRVGAFALSPGSDDAALLITVPPGAYTVEVRGKNDGEGVALLEIYEVP